MVTYKDLAVAAMLDADASGRMRSLHDQLIALGCKTTMARNTATLRFDVGSSARRVAIAAFRGGSSEIFSFPKTYWGGRVAELDRALISIEQRHFVDLEGPGSSSQYSARQVRISPETSTALAAVVSGLIATHIQALS